ncbi:MAG: LLM class flavin-dependent oxidoreductase [Myxococcales bacterium]|nr:MAG: LLM class flavin-dependent oxidoreductase [Myxococcales bacterium]
MASDFLWYLPTHGDGRNLAAGAFHRGERGGYHRPPSLDYLTQVALAAESAGFFGALIPTGPYCEDAWAVAAATAVSTRRLKSLVAFRPGFVLPAVAAQTVATLQRFTGDRLLLNVVTGGSSTEQRAYGDFLDHDARYERTDEFLSVVRGVWSGPGFNFEGRHYRVDNAGLTQPLERTPTIYFGGASAAAERVAAKHADVYLTWGETPPMLVPRIASVRDQAAKHGRKVRIGIRLHLISRDTEEDAWREAERLLQTIPPGAIEQAQKQFAASESVGQSRMVGLHHGKLGDARTLEVYPNLWAGVGLVRGGAGTAVIGSHEQVAARIREYESLGVDTFIFSAYPNLEEAVRIGEDLLPLLSR